MPYETLQRKMQNVGASWSGLLMSMAVYNDHGPRNGLVDPYMLLGREFSAMPSPTRLSSGWLVLGAVCKR